MSESRTNQLAEQVYNDLKGEIFDFHLLPGDRFTETELANRYNVSRTPIRDALYRLKREGYLDVAFRSGWSVKPLDFRRFHELYELRILLECGAVERLCRAQPTPDLTALMWPDDNSRVSDPHQLAAIDESFHLTLMRLAGNQEMAQVHAQLTEKIRIVRRLDFSRPSRVEAAYREHPKILQLILQRKELEAQMMLRAHIMHSEEEVQKITLHMLYEAREAARAVPAS
jgi:DNA-binding GntR family transcriptional regulator